MTDEGLRKRLATAGSGPGLWAVVDQGVVSLGTFATTLVLARDLPTAEFGVFGILMGLLLTAVTVHTSLIGVPLMVLTAKSADRRRLATLALGLATASTAVFAVVMVVALTVLGRPGLMPTIALALVGAEVQETLRRSLMGGLEFGRAVAGDAVSYLGQAVGVGLLAAGNRATVAGAFAVMGISSLAAAVLQLVQVRPWFGLGGFGLDDIRPFWRLGRALVVVNGIGAVTLQSLVWILGLLQDVTAVARLQALFTVVGPTNPLMAAAHSLVTARAAHVRHEDVATRRRLELDIVRRYGLAVAVPLLAYCAALFAAPAAALELFFGTDSFYRGLGPELRMFVLFSVGLYIYFVVAGLLNARQDIPGLLRAQLGSALVVAVAVPMIAVWSVGGAVVAAVASAAARAFLATVRCLPRRA